MELDPKVGFYRFEHIYKNALQAACWIYHKDRRLWFTPEEFKEVYGKKQLTHSQIAGILEELVIRDPIAGIKAGHKALAEKRTKFEKDYLDELIKLDEFSKKAIQYYQAKPKK